MVITTKVEDKENLLGTINEKRLTKGQLYLGATENFTLDKDNYVSFWCQNPEIKLYSIAGYYQGNFFWIQYTYLKHARNIYKKVQTILKRQKKTVKDILKLDECYNFHKEIS